MPVYRCSKCGVMENTAASGYWSQQDRDNALCTQCDPKIGKWHGIFKRMSAKGMMLASDGFLYAKEDVASDSFKFRMKHQGLKVVREITE